MKHAGITKETAWRQNLLLHIMHKGLIVTSIHCDLRVDYNNLRLIMLFANAGFLLLEYLLDDI